MRMKKMAEEKSQGENMTEEFKQFFENEIRQLIENYAPLNSREAWYKMWYLDPPEDIDAEEYISMLFKLRQDPAVSSNFKVFMLQLVSVVNNRYLEPRKTKSS
jgi:hypothetical protein